MAFLLTILSANAAAVEFFLDLLQFDTMRTTSFAINNLLFLRECPALSCVEERLSLLRHTTFFEVFDMPKELSSRLMMTGEPSTNKFTEKLVLLLRIFADAGYYVY